MAVEAASLEARLRVLAPSPDAVEFTWGARVKLDDQFGRLVAAAKAKANGDNHATARVAALACGPAGAMRDFRVAAALASVDGVSFDVHTERFFF